MPFVISLTSCLLTVAAEQDVNRILLSDNNFLSLTVKVPVFMRAREIFASEMTKKDTLKGGIQYSCSSLENIAVLTSPNCDYGDPEVARIALELLQTVPITRDVVLETLFRFFLKASQCHFSSVSSNIMQKMDEGDKRGGPSNEMLDLCLSVKDAFVAMVEKAPKVCGFSLVILNLSKCDSVPSNFGLLNNF